MAVYLPPHAHYFIVQSGGDGRIIIENRYSFCK